MLQDMVFAVIPYPPPLVIPPPLAIPPPLGGNGHDIGGGITREGGRKVHISQSVLSAIIWTVGIGGDTFWVGLTLLLFLPPQLCVSHGLLPVSPTLNKC